MGSAIAMVVVHGDAVMRAVPLFSWSCAKVLVSVGLGAGFG